MSRTTYVIFPSPLPSSGQILFPTGKKILQGNKLRRVISFLKNGGGGVKHFVTYYRSGGLAFCNRLNQGGRGKKKAPKSRDVVANAQTCRNIS
jgi:hypothetical protein